MSRFATGCSVDSMTTHTGTDPMHVVIAGGGVAALETMMALRSLVADRVRITLLAPERDYHYRPMAVAEPFSIAHARHVALVANRRGLRCATRPQRAGLRRGR